MKKMKLLRVPEVLSIETERGWQMGQPKELGAVLDDVTVELEIRDDQVVFSVTAQETRVKHILVQWEESPGENGKILRDHWERGYGDICWGSISPHKELPWYFMVSDGKQTDGYGVMTGPGALCSWYLDGNYVSLLLDVRCGTKGVLLRGRKLQAAVMVMRAGEKGESPFQAAQAFCQMMCKKPRLPKTPVYGGNNWYYAYGVCSEHGFLEDCRLQAELAEGLENRPYMVLDDGWQISHKNTGKSIKDAWLPHPDKFPDMKKMTEKIRDMGVRPGIWYRPLAAVPGVEKEWLLDQKPDPSVPEVLERIGRDIRRFREWGFELLKHDFTTYDCFGKWGVEFCFGREEKMWCFRDETRTTAEIILNLYRVIRENAADMLVIGCNTYSHLAAGMFELQRTGDDTSGHQWERTRKMGINTLAFRMPQHNAFYAVDADCVGIASTAYWSLNKRWLDLLSKSGTPLFVSLSPVVADEEIRQAVRQAFKIASLPRTVSEPVDWMDNMSPCIWRTMEGEDRYCWTQLGKVELCEGTI